MVSNSRDGARSQVRGSSPHVDNLALAVALGVVGLTLASQVGLGPGDFLTVAVFGFVGATFCVVAAVKTGRWRSWLGVVLSLLPVALLVYFLANTDG